MTFDEEGRLWRAEMAANRARYDRWLKQRTAPESDAIVRARELIHESEELIATSRALRSANR